MKFKDLTGQRFGRLTIINRAPNRKQFVRWNCVCDCGNHCVCPSQTLLNGKSRSCGCLVPEVNSMIHKKHGLKRTSLYTIWKGMRERCHNPKATNYYRYGQRGVKICDEWNDYANFYQWALDNGYQQGLTLDRINNNGDYTPDNCRWVDKMTQGNNKCNNRIIEYNGQKYTLMQLSRLCGIERRVLGYRLNRGWSVEQAITINPRYGNKIIRKDVY